MYVAATHTTIPQAATSSLISDGIVPPVDAS
jgi:hypothetical protein